MIRRVEEIREQVRTIESQVELDKLRKEYKTLWKRIVDEKRTLLTRRIAFDRDVPALETCVQRLREAREQKLDIFECVDEYAMARFQKRRQEAEAKSDDAAKEFGTTFAYNELIDRIKKRLRVKKREQECVKESFNVLARVKPISRIAFMNRHKRAETARKERYSKKAKRARAEARARAALALAEQKQEAQKQQKKIADAQERQKKERQERIAEIRAKRLKKLKKRLYDGI